MPLDKAVIYLVMGHCFYRSNNYDQGYMLIPSMAHTLNSRNIERFQL